MNSLRNLVRALYLRASVCMDAEICSKIHWKRGKIRTVPAVHGVSATAFIQPPLRFSSSDKTSLPGWAMFRATYNRRTHYNQKQDIWGSQIGGSCRTTRFKLSGTISPYSNLLVMTESLLRAPLGKLYLQRDASSIWIFCVRGAQIYSDVRVTTEFQPLDAPHRGPSTTEGSIMSPNAREAIWFYVFRTQICKWLHNRTCGVSGIRGWYLLAEVRRQTGSGLIILNHMQTRALYWSRFWACGKARPSEWDSVDRR